MHLIAGNANIILSSSVLNQIYIVVCCTGRKQDILSFEYMHVKSYRSILTTVCLIILTIRAVQNARVRYMSLSSEQREQTKELILFLLK